MPVRRTQGWLPGILDDFFGNEWVDKTSSTAPAVNVIETDKEYKVEIAAPGLTRDDFKIDINEDNELTVSMEKKVEKNEESEKEGKKHTYLRREFSYSSFRQRMILPDNVNVDNIDAKMENGVLTIDIPKKTEEEKRKNMRQIDIK
ncbi:putative uncharacterized protein [Alistipes sp. CAG:157]|nr:Hsp20/alpha crystallin family protein [Rikenellaceae bacterium]OKY82807.1 MAG: heat-shock protein [Alistipes sp. 56_11]CCZ99443.1 putative uncharacterized protein [Alistipes sp. CAG:157]HAD56564.1 Hsp20/alpha crystallin family protein [Alistipes sp.]